MANRIKGITVEIGGDTTKLQTALKGVNGQIKSTQQQLKDVDKLLKLDPGNTELLAQKHKLLAEAVGETKEKLATLKTAAEQANTALANGEISQEQYDALQREIIETEQDLKNLETQANQSATAMQKIAATGESLKTTGDNISNAGKKILPVTAAVTAMGGASIQTAANFESSMSQVQATMGVTKESMTTLDGQSVNTMDALSKLAQEMGASTAFSATECAEALNYLALAGYDTQQMADTLPTVLNLAAAGGIDLASASDMVTDAMSALGMEVSDADVMVDQMAKTASTTNTSVAQLGEGILTIGATAKSVKGGTAELNTALGILANNGIKGAEGGTHLRNIILSLQNPTDKAADAMESLGVQVYDSQGNMRSMNDILGDLHTSMDGMTSAEKDNIISKIFNKTDLAAANALLANTGKSWDDLQSSIANSGGAAQQMADTQLDNLQGQLTLLKSALEGLAISFGQLLMPAIKSIVGVLQKVVDWLNSLDEGTKKVIVTVALVAGALGPVLIIVGKVISAVGTIMTVIPKLSGAITAVKTAFAALNTTMLANPIFLIIAAIAALVAAFIYLWNTNEDFRQFWIDLWENVKQVAIIVWNAIKAFFQTVWDAIKVIFETVFGVIKTLVTTYFNLYKTIIETVFNVIKTVITTIWEAIKGVFTTVFNVIKTIVTTYFNIYKTIIQTVLTVIQTVITTVWNTIKTVITTVMNAIKTIFTTVWNAIKTIIQAVVSGIKGLITGDFTAVKNSITDVAGNIIRITGTENASGDTAGGIAAGESAGTGIPETKSAKGISAEVDLSGLTSAEMSYDSANRLVEYNGEKVKYDADGNMTYGPLNGEMTEFQYDCRNRLISAGRMVYAYDAEDTRISAETPEYTEEYITESHSSEYSRILEVKRNAKEETGTDKTKEKAETTRYVYGKGLISQTDTNGYRYYHYNHLGSTIQLTDVDGNVTDSYTYGTYGELLSGVAEHTRFLYNGRYGVTTDENGLYNMRARYYNTDIRRFINQDIITGSIGNSQSLNRYAYVQGNPVSYTDPFGLSPLNAMADAVGHAVLDLIGSIPVFGAPANILNCYWYCKEGNREMAVMSGIAILPGVGQFIGAGAKALKLTRTSQYIITATKFAGSMANCMIAVGTCIETGKRIYHDIRNGKFGLNVNTVANIATIGLSVFAAAVSGKEMAGAGVELANMVAEDLHEFGVKVDTF